MLLNAFYSNFHSFSFSSLLHFIHTWKSQHCRFKTCSKEDATVIFRDAAIYNMTDTGHVWIVTEQALFSNNTPIGTLGLKLNNDNETEHITVRGFQFFRWQIDLNSSSKARLFKCDAVRVCWNLKLFCDKILVSSASSLSFYYPLFALLIRAMINFNFTHYESLSRAREARDSWDTKVIEPLLLS